MSQTIASFGEGSAKVDVVDWGRIDYLEAWDLQKELVEKRTQGLIPDTLVFCEHNPVITLGRGAQRGDAPFLNAGEIPILNIERGGLSTYHGPGQFVAYPIFQLARKSTSWSRAGVVNLIRSMEDWMIGVLAEQGLESKAICEKTGVWVTAKTPYLMEKESSSFAAAPSERKIASIGIAVKRWVSYHGLAMNFDTGLDPWKAIKPCGFQANVMTDLQMETGLSYSYDKVKVMMLDKFWKHFGSERVIRGAVCDV